MAVEYVFSKRDSVLIRTIDERIGDEHKLAGLKIKGRSHSADDVFSYYNNLKAFFSKNCKMSEGSAEYTDVLVDTVSCVMYDFSRYIEKGGTFRDAFDSLNRIREGPELQFRDLGSKIKGLLYGRAKPEIDFPDFLSALWTLKTLRPGTYESSLNTAKWSFVIAKGINAFSARQGLGLSVDEDEILAYSALMNMGMLFPGVPLADSDRKFTDNEREKLESHSKLGIVFLLNAGFPLTDNFSKIVGHHTDPVDLHSGVVAAAETFEGMYFRKRHKQDVIATEEVVDEIGCKLTTESDIAAIKQSMTYGRILDMDLIKKNYMILPWYVLRILLGIEKFSPA
jgi:hypothetical protein